MQGIKNYQTGTPGYRYEIVRLKTKLIQLGNRMWSRFAFAPTISVAQNPKKSIFGRLIPLCPDMRHWHRFLSDTGKKRDSDLAVWYLPNWASFSSIRRRPGVIHVKYMSATEPMRTSHASSAVYVTVFLNLVFLLAFIITTFTMPTQKDRQPLDQTVARWRVLYTRPRAWTDTICSSLQPFLRLQLLSCILLALFA